MAQRIPRLGEIMIQKGWITWDQLAEALKIKKETSTPEIAAPGVKKNHSKQTFLNIGEILLNQGWVKSNALADALMIQQETGDILGHILIRKGYVTEKELQHALAIQHGMTFAEIDTLSIPQDTIQLIPKYLAYDHQFLPLVKQDHLLLIAVANPKDVNAETAVRRLFPDGDILIALMTSTDIKKGLAKYYGSV